MTKPMRSRSCPLPTRSIVRCILGGAASPNVALTATMINDASKKKRRKSNQELDFGVSCHSVALATKAEGTGLEPATPYGALHFQ